MAPNNSTNHSVSSFSLKSIGISGPGKRFILSKALTESSIALNLVMYLLLKADRSDEGAPLDIQTHPVMSALDVLSGLEKKLREDIEAGVSGLSEQLSNLEQAVDYLKTGVIEEQDTSEDVDEKSSEDLGVDGDDGDDDDEADRASQKSIISAQGTGSTERDAANEARFAVRAIDIKQTSSQVRRRLVDYGDDDSTGSAPAAQTLAATLNSISQKVSNYNENHDDAVEMLDRNGTGFEKRMEDFDAEGDIEMSDKEQDEVLNNYYHGVASLSAKKKSKSQAYAPVPRFPHVDREVEGERAVSKAIMRNRGLVAHKSKLNRNPRVKKREQYRKAVVRRKGNVREIRRDEGHKYGGEETGIKSDLSRSRRLAR